MLDMSHVKPGRSDRRGRGESPAAPARERRVTNQLEPERARPRGCALEERWPLTAPPRAGSSASRRSVLRARAHTPSLRDRTGLCGSPSFTPGRSRAWIPRWESTCINWTRRSGGLRRSQVGQIERSGSPDGETIRSGASPLGGAASSFPVVPGSAPFGSDSRASLIRTSRRVPEKIAAFGALFPHRPPCVTWRSDLGPLRKRSSHRDSSALGRQQAREPPIAHAFRSRRSAFDALYGPRDDREVVAG